MKCPECDGDTIVVDSRPLFDGETIYRRRKCKSCDHLFTTYEVLLKKQTQYVAMLPDYITLKNLNRG